MRVLLILAIACCIAAQQPQPGAYAIAGTVADHLSGRPLSGILVTVGPVAQDSEPIAMLTAADGRFLFPNLPAGKYSLRAQRRAGRPQGYLQHGRYSTAIVTGPGLDSEHITFPLTAPARLTGIAVDSEGDPVPDAEVMLIRRDVVNGRLQFFRWGETRASQTGAFHFSNLPASRYYIAVQGRPWYAQGAIRTPGPLITQPELNVAYAVTYSGDTTDPAAAQAIQLSEGATSDVRITLHAVPAVTLTLQADEQTSGMGGSLVPIFLGGLFVRGGGVGTDHGNRIELAPVAPGRYDLIANLGPDRIRKTLDLTADTTLELSKEDAAQRLCHITIDDPVSGAAPRMVILRSADTSYAVHSIGNGGLEFPPLAPGHYQVSLSSSPDFYIKSISLNGVKSAGDFIDVPASGGFNLSIVAARFVLDKLEGVVEHDGKPTPAAMVLLIPEDLSRVSLIRRDQSDSDGSFSMSKLAPGRYTLLAIDAEADFTYADPAVIKPYLTHGQPVTIAAGFHQRLSVPLISRER